MDVVARRELQSALVRLADGDRAAFHPAFTLAWPAVRGFCRAWLRDEGEAEDAAQEALLKVFERASSFDPTRDALSWVLTLAAWECRTVRRRRQRRREEPQDAAGPRASTAATPEHAAVEADLRRALLETMSELPENDRETLRALVEEGSRPEVAGATFRKRLERALKRLRAAWTARQARLERARE